MTASGVALVTGGTRGIGLGIARRLAADGWSLALNGVRDAAEIGDVLAELSASTEVCYAQADISTPAGRTSLVEAVRSRFGRVDALVNNAGVAPAVRADILEAGEESFERLLRTNLQGPHFLTQAVARWMLTTEPTCPRSIVFVTSVSAAVASVNRGDYCVSKAGLSMSARLFAVRLAEHGIPVYEVRPGIIATDMTAGVTAKYDKLIEEGLLLQPRWGTPDDVGRAVAALVRGDLAYSTGSVVMVDGGMTVGRL